MEQEAVDSTRQMRITSILCGAQVFPVEGDVGLCQQGLLYPVALALGQGPTRFVGVTFGHHALMQTMTAPHSGLLLLQH